MYQCVFSEKNRVHYNPVRSRPKKKRLDDNSDEEEYKQQQQQQQQGKVGRFCFIRSTTNGMKFETLA
jgi:hypothetical protein